MPRTTMVKIRISRFAWALLVSLAASNNAVASLAAAPEYLYFNANCTDCALAANTDFYNVVVTLKLDGYGYGTPLKESSSTQYGNVVSFSYSGSNLVAPIHVLLPQVGDKTPPSTYFSIESIRGQIDTSGPNWTSPSGGEMEIDFRGDGHRFSIEPDGDWAYFAGTGSDDPNDYGHGFWSDAPGPVGPRNLQIPEPGSLILMACGLAVLGAGRFRKAPG